jgi:multiple sugar transport system permease protein
MTSAPPAGRRRLRLRGRIDADWVVMSAGGVLAALPIMVFALPVQRHLVRGLTLGAVK